MIPLFPEFKHLEFSDKASLESFTKDFLPYSDFNFTSLWCWDIQKKIMISNLNNNLVIKFADYGNGEPFYSFLGKNNAEGTARDLVALAKKERITTTLRLLPEESVASLQGISDFDLKEDRDNFDYVFSIDHLAMMDGSKLASKRNYIKQFTAHHQYRFVQMDLADDNTWREVSKICKEWADNKNISPEDFAHEFYAIRRYFSMGSYEKHYIVGIYIEDILSAFWGIEVLSEDYAISHFQKAMTGKFRGIYPFLNQAGAKMLQEKNISFINFEQDLGFPGLREGKMDYDPINYIKKFTLDLK